MPFRVQHLLAASLLTMVSLTPASADDRTIATGQDLMYCSIQSVLRTVPPEVTRCQSVAIERSETGTTYRFIFSNYPEFELFAPHNQIRVGQSEQNSEQIESSITSLNILFADGRTRAFNGKGECKEYPVYGISCHYDTLQNESFIFTSGWRRQLNLGE